MEPGPSRLLDVRPIAETDLRAPDVARVLGVCGKTLMRWRQAGGGPPWRRIGARHWYPAAGLQRFLEQRTQQPMS